jgi:hypothetical protein
MKFWIGAVVDPLVDEVFRAARTPLMKALTGELAGRSFGTNVEFWSVTPMLISETLPFNEECVFRRRRKEYLVSEFLSPVEFLAASREDRIRILGGLVRRSIERAGPAGVTELDAPLMLDAVDRAIALTVIGV